MICLLWFNALSCFFHMFTEVGGEKRERKQAVLKSVTDSCKPWWLLKDCHFCTGASSAWGQQHHKDMHCPLPASATCGYMWTNWSQEKKNIKREQGQVIAHNAERHHSGNLLPLAKAPTHKNKSICGRMKEGKKEERQTGAVTEDRGRHGKGIHIK